MPLPPHTNPQTHKHQALNLLLPPVLNDYVFATDKRAGAARLIHEPPLFALGVPDSCAYVPGTHYCQIDVINVFVKWGVWFVLVWLV